MSNISADSAPVSESREKPLLAPHRIALVVIWVVTTAAIVVMLFHNVRSTGQYKEVRYVLQVGYVAALLWYLGRSGPSVNQLPETRPQVLPRWRFGAWIPVLVIALLFALTLVSELGVSILMLLIMVATGPILLAWRREIRRRSVIQGLTVALIAFLAGSQMSDNGFISKLFLYLLPGFSFPMYVAGGLLYERTRLGGIQLLTGQYGKAVKSVLWGGLLFIPLGLLNAAGGSPGPGITWVTKWWQPLWLPWFSGIAEETWFRLFLMGLCFFFLRPAFRSRPAVAVVASVLFSGITFGMLHGFTLERFLVTGLLYGVPMAAVFARRDWEHAVGAHYMVNMIPWLMVFLET
jgi:hypothetical protein